MAVHLCFNSKALRLSGSENMILQFIEAHPEGINSAKLKELLPHSQSARVTLSQLRNKMKKAFNRDLLIGRVGKEPSVVRPRARLARLTYARPADLKPKRR